MLREYASQRFRINQSAPPDLSPSGRQPVRAFRLFATAEYGSRMRWALLETREELAGRAGRVRCVCAFVEARRVTRSLLRRR